MKNKREKYKRKDKKKGKKRSAKKGRQRAKGGKTETKRLRSKSPECRRADTHGKPARRKETA